MKLALAGQSYSNSSLAAAAQQCLNWFAETIEDPNGSGKGKQILRGAPGFHTLVNLNAQPGVVRGIASGGNRCFVAVGPFSGAGTLYIYEINNAGTILATTSFSTTANSRPVQLLFNGNQMGIVADGQFYCDNGDGFGPVATRFQINGKVTTAGTAVAWVSGDTFPVLGNFNRALITINGVNYTVSSVTNSTNLVLTGSAGTQTAVAYNAAAGSLVTAVTGTYLDGSFFVQRPITAAPDLGRQVSFSAVFDGTKWAGLDFFSKESYPDHIQSILADREQLFVFGDEQGSEVWQNDPNTGRPVRVQGAVAQEPSSCRYAPVSMNQKVYFLGGTHAGGPVAYRMDGFTPTRISTHAVEEQWATSGVNIATSVGWWYLEEGHYSWVIWFSGGQSWVYDANEKFWSERRSKWNGSAFTTAYLPWVHTFIPGWFSGNLQGLHVVGDHQSAKVYIMSNTFFDEDTLDMRRVRDMPYLFSDGKRIFVGRVQLTMAASGAVPKLAWSSDDGATFSTLEDGSVATPSYWLAQGSFEGSAIPRIVVSGQLEATMIDVDAEVTFGRT